jgi:hypothetical protein
MDQKGKGWIGKERRGNERVPPGANFNRQAWNGAEMTGRDSSGTNGRGEQCSGEVW